MRHPLKGIGAPKKEETMRMNMTPSRDNKQTNFLEKKKKKQEQKQQKQTRRRRPIFSKSLTPKVSALNIS